MVLRSENSLSYRNFIQLNNLLEPSGPLQAFNGINLPFYPIMLNYKMRNKQITIEVICLFLILSDCWNRFLT